LYVVYLHHFPAYAAFPKLFGEGPQVPLDQLAHLAGTFAAALFVLQNLAVLAITPAYLAGAIAGEQERGTLDLLLASPLTDREIVVGKMVGRLAHLASLLLTGLPVFLALQWWGGVEPLLPFCAFSTTWVILFSVGAVCIWLSVRLRNNLRAMTVSYMIVIPVGLIGFASPYLSFFLPTAAAPLYLEGRLGAGDLHQLVWGPETVPLYRDDQDRRLVLLLFCNSLLFGFGIANGFLAAAIRRLRRLRQPRVADDAAGRMWLATLERLRAKIRSQRVGSIVDGWGPEEPPTALPKRKVRSGVRKPVTNSPFLWKEIFHGVGALASKPSWWQFLCGAGIGLCFVLPARLLFDLVWTFDDPSRSLLRNGQPFSATVLNPELRVLGIVLAGAWCASTAWIASRSVSLEREQRTLDSLFTLPIARGVILNAKWWGSIWRVHWLAAVLLAAYTVGFVVGAIPWIALLATAAACAVHVAFLASAGVFLSSWCRSTVRANLAMAAVLLAIFVGTWVVAEYRHVFFGPAAGAENWSAQFLRVGLNPLRAWWHLGRTWDESGLEVSAGAGTWGGEWSAAFAGMGVYAGLAVALWVAARCRFARLDRA
jgi:ABC-type transport system involved in multi-copper enzyme maturation permease subunit